MQKEQMRRVIQHVVVNRGDHNPVLLECFYYRVYLRRNQDKVTRTSYFVVDLLKVECSLESHAGRYRFIIGMICFRAGNRNRINLAI